MKNVLIKLRSISLICCCYLRIFWTKVTLPFRIPIIYIKRYCAISKIYKESNDGWERHVKIREMDKKDELALEEAKSKTLFISTFSRTSMSAGKFIELQGQYSEAINAQQEFQRNKEELVERLEQLCDCEEINFDEGIKSEIIAWKFETYKTQEELLDWVMRFFEYVYTLDNI